MIKKFNSVFFLSLVMLSTNSFAKAEKKDVCVRYQSNWEWSKGYAVEATIIDGSDLNSAVGKYNAYSSFKTYAVIFWNKGQATVLQLPYSWLSISYQDVYDKDGSAWQIKEGSYCY